MAYVRHVTDYPGMLLRAFLVVEDGTGYLVNYSHEQGDFGFLCPCCTSLANRRAINDAVETAIKDGIVQGKVRWCCHQNDAPQFGDRVGEFGSPLRQHLFCGGSTREMSAEAKAQLHTLALTLPALAPADW